VEEVTRPIQFSKISRQYRNNRMTELHQTASSE
jgi:hypothetical protein